MASTSNVLDAYALIGLELHQVPESDQDAFAHRVAAKKFGTVEHDGRTLALTQQAYCDAYGTDGTVCYYASAVDDEGGTYKVRWDTTADWDAQCAAATAEHRWDGHTIGIDAARDQFSGDVELGHFVSFWTSEDGQCSLPMSWGSHAVAHDAEAEARAEGMTQGLDDGSYSVELVVSGHTDTLDDESDACDWESPAEIIEV